MKLYQLQASQKTQHYTVGGTVEYVTVKVVVNDGLGATADLWHIWNEMDDWCAAQWGERPLNQWPCAQDRWFASNSAFWFRQPQDATAFLLRWQ